MTACSCAKWKIVYKSIAHDHGSFFFGLPGEGC